METRTNIFTIIALFLTLIVPILVLPMVLDNAFNTPKTSLMLFGALMMAGIYGCRFLAGKEVRISRASTPRIILVLVVLNGFSFFYTANPYYTVHAATMNLTCLFLLYFISLYVDRQGAFFILLTAAFSGILVSIETYLQFLDVFLIFRWAHPGIMVMGTIGNSNYLGAYLVFPLFALAGLVFLLKGRLRLLPVIFFVFVLGALLFTRARAGWFGFFLSLPLFLLMLKRIHRFHLGVYLRPRLTQTATWFFVSLSILVGLWYAAPERLHTMLGYRNVTNALTLKLRMKKYSAGSVWLFKQSPLFGTGLWSYRNMVFEAQAQINKTDPDFFTDYPEPKPESVHNEYLEVLNDGGLVAATVILLFIVLLFRHAWRVIRDDGLELTDRTMMATALSAVVAILLAAFFFFPFRINSTFFMTAIMMGLVEGIYLRNYGLIGLTSGTRSGTRVLLIPLLILLLVGIAWYRGTKPFMAEVQHFKYKMALAVGNARDAEKYILKAIEWDPHNTVYNFHASQVYMNMLGDYRKASDYIEKATLDYNGDIIRWTIYYIKGLLKFQAGSLFEAQAAFEKSLYYNPTFGEARQKLGEVKKVIKDHDRVLIKFR
ncbi:MAG: O-antigen ligase family protein [Deltaproteobacteria bacterium]|nr:O-antigen ligase family protein [Deltaproteobacteria bacterium]